MNPAYDAVLIGAGHNGLTCACYLARAGLRVRVLESREVLGGAAVTEEFHPGFRNSTAGSAWINCSRRDRRWATVTTACR